MESEKSALDSAMALVRDAQSNLVFLKKELEAGARDETLGEYIDAINSAEVMARSLLDFLQSCGAVGGV